VRTRVKVGSAVAAALAALACGCARAPEARGKVRVVLQASLPWGPPAPFRELLAEFERRNPDVELVVQPAPASSDLSRQLLLVALQGGAADLDVFALDVIWVPELARAGWIADLSAAFPPDRLRAEMLPAAADSAVLDGRTFAVPWYADVGLLYWRTDLVARAPRTYDELARAARAAMAAHPGLAGIVWQGRQYEGLTCNALEAAWGHGGAPQRGERLVLDTPAARAGLAWLRELVAGGLSPPSVVTAAEEDARRLFQAGRAAFMRNWPYAWAELAREGSPVRGRVGTAPLPSLDGAAGHGALGGWDLAVSARSTGPRRAAAERLVAHLTSPEAGLVLALHYARNPARRGLYRDRRLTEGAPFIASLLPLLEDAWARPVSPYYDLAADAVQAELSAALIGLRTPAEALARAQRQVDRIAGVSR
jgi:multiple sugar transport system substrate-binding protein